MGFFCFCAVLFVSLYFGCLFVFNMEMTYISLYFIKTLVYIHRLYTLSSCFWEDSVRDTYNRTLILAYTTKNDLI